MYNIEQFKTNLTTLNWHNTINPTNNININYKNFHDTITSLLNICIPKRKIKLQNHYKKHWLTVGIKISSYNKRLLKIITLKTKNKILIDHYKCYEKILKKSIITAKKLHYISKLKNSHNKIKTMWSIVKERTNKKCIKEKNNIKLQINNNIITDPYKVANTFLDHFSCIGGSTTSSVAGHSVLFPSENSMYLSPVEYQEVYKIIKNLKNKKSCGIDEIPPCLFKKCAIELTYPLTSLINQSFEEGAFPDYLKKSIIKPMHKKNEKTNPTNYRPIALLPTASKVFEKAMNNRIYNFCEKYKILDDCQNGFRENRSTVLAVYKYIQKVLDIINEKQYAVGILLDMTKAYDKVQFNILLHKLYGIGVRGNSFNWLKSYLSDREQLVEIEYFNFNTKEIKQIRSPSKYINASIPQGSVIGCLLFLIYINDLPKIMSEPCVMFADDISLLTSCNNNSNINNKLQLILNKTTNWMKDHNLELNFLKTKLITFHPYQKTPLNVNFTYNNIKIDVVKEFTLLGLVINTQLDWKPHVQKLKNKLSSFKYALYEVKKTTDIKTSLNVYYAYAHAWLSYGVIMWGNSTAAPDLLILQKKLIRIIFNIKNIDSCKPYFLEYKILTLPCIYILELCKFVKKYPDFFKTRHENLSNRYEFRNNKNLIYLSSRLKLHSSGPQIMCIKIYNKLPKSIKNINKEKDFINETKQLLINKRYYSVQEYLNDKLSDYN
jgi:hypothetical protein